MDIIKKYILLFICMILLAFGISGCAETPEVVKKEIAEIERAKKEQKLLKKEIKYVSLGELQKEADENLTIKRGVFCFDGEVIVPKCENVYFLKMQANDEIFKNIDENMQRTMEHIGKSGKRWEDYIGGKNSSEGRNYWEKGYCFVTLDSHSISVDQAGGFSIYENADRGKHPYFLDDEVLDTVFFVNDREAKLEQKINLNNEEVTLRDLDAVFEKEVEFFNSCSPKLNLALHDVRIIKNNETKNTMAVFRALSNYDGVSFDPNYIMLQDSEASGGKSFVGFEMVQPMHEPGDTCSVNLR